MGEWGGRLGERTKGKDTAKVADAVGEPRGVRATRPGGVCLAQFGQGPAFQELGGVPLGWLLHSGNGQTSYARSSPLATVTLQVRAAARPFAVIGGRVVVNVGVRQE